MSTTTDKKQTTATPNSTLARKPEEKPTRSAAFIGKVQREFAAVLGEGVTWGPLERSLAQHLFLKMDAALTAAEAKREEAGMQAAAAILGLPLHFLKPAAMKAVAGRVQTTSPRVLALFGVPSVAETAALAGAGDLSELVLARITRDNVTCAIARAPLIKETAA